MLYKKVTQQYGNPEILRIVRSLIPQDILSQTTTKDDWNIVPLLRWFKNDFMKWTPKDPVCEMCVLIEVMAIVMLSMVVVMLGR
ncbi:MAG TPA: hypothetical protein VFQ47_10315 [Nitrososphaera sp.]|nr:hypothetical protein [Nitrososphaera sp.]